MNLQVLLEVKLTNPFSKGKSQQTITDRHTTRQSSLNTIHTTMRAAYMLAKHNQAAPLLTLTSVHAARSITPYVDLLQRHNVGIESLELLNNA